MPDAQNSGHNESEFILETKEAPQSRRAPAKGSSGNVFGVNPPQRPSSQTNFFDPFEMQNPAHAAQQNAAREVFDDDLLGHKPAPKGDPFDMGSQPQRAQPVQTSNQNDLDIFFGSSATTPAPAPVQAKKPEPFVRASDSGQVNKNDVSGFTVYNQLNTSNMKDMSAMGINNFLDINQGASEQNQATPKFDLREEPSGTIFDDGGNTAQAK